MWWGGVECEVVDWDGWCMLCGVDVGWWSGMGLCGMWGGGV